MRWATDGAGGLPPASGKASIRGPTPSHAKTNTKIRREWFNTSGWLPNRRHTLVQPAPGSVEGGQGAPGPLHPDPQLCPHPQLVETESLLRSTLLSLSPMQDELALQDCCPLLPYRMNYTKGFLLFLLWHTYRLSLPARRVKDNSSHLTCLSCRHRLPRQDPVSTITISETQRDSWQKDSFLEVGLGPLAESVTPSKANPSSIADTFLTSSPL